MVLAPIENVITAQEYLSREDMSLVLYNIKTDVTTTFTAAELKQERKSKTWYPPI